LAKKILSKPIYNKKRMGILRIYPEKNNTIASGAYKAFNSGQNAVTDLWYGGGGTDTAPEKRNSFSRFLVKFDISDLQNKIANVEINTGLTVTYRLKMKNAIPKDKVLESEYEFDVLNKNIAASFDLICFPINKDWDEGRGYDLGKEYYLVKQKGNPQVTGYSNWNSATSTIAWDAPGVYADPTGATFSTYSGSTSQSGMTIAALPGFATISYFNFTTSANQFMQNGEVSATTIGNNISIDFADFYSGETIQSGITFTISNQAISTGWTFTTSANTNMADGTITASTIGNDTFISFSGSSISTTDWYNSLSITSFSGFGITVTGDSSSIFINSAGTEIFILSADTASNPISTQSWLNAINSTPFSSLNIIITGDSPSSYIGTDSFTLSANTISLNSYFYSSQHFDLGNEDIDMDITDIVNDWLSGGSVNNGIGIAYRRDFELFSTDTRYISSFFTSHTNTAYKPTLEVSYNQTFKDDRSDVTNNRRCKLFLYTFSGNNPVNFYSASTVSIQTYGGVPVPGLSALTPTQVETGVYYVDVWMSAATKGQQYRDIWNGVTFNPGYDQQNYTQFFTIQDNFYFTNVPNVNNYAISTYGLDNNSIINTNEIIRVYADLRVNFSTNPPKNHYDLQYRIVMNNQESVIPWTSFNQAMLNKCMTNYFVLDTSWLLHNQTYEVQLRMNELGTIRVLPEKIKFRVLRDF
jgi:hypothetical protein